MIPLAFDHGCMKTSGCSGRFRSFETFGDEGNDLSKPLMDLFRQTTGAGLSQDMIAEEVKNTNGKESAVLKNAKII